MTPTKSSPPKLLTAHPSGQQSSPPDSSPPSTSKAPQSDAPKAALSRVQVELQRTGNTQPLDYCSKLRGHGSDPFDPDNAGALMLGVFGGSFAVTSGLTTFGHEVGGHIYLGWGSVTQGDLELKYQVDGFDNLKAIGKAPTLLGKIKATGNWLIGADSNGDGATGYAYRTGKGVSAFGQILGEQGRSAWVSGVGSVPDLAFNSLTMLAGMKLRHEHPAFGYALIGCSATNHLITATYPLSAAFMSSAEIKRIATTRGHDFANLAYRLSNITGLPARVFAITTAAAFVGIVPAVALGVYLYQRAQKRNAIPDGLALQYWLSKSPSDPEIDRRFRSLLEAYPRRQRLAEVTQRLIQADHQSSAQQQPLSPEERQELLAKFLSAKEDFDRYLIDAIGPEVLGANKSELLRKWQEAQSGDGVEKLLAKLSASGTALMLGTPALQVAANTLAPALSTVAAVATQAMPITAALNTAYVGYRTYQDLQAPEAKMPKAAKALSVGQALLSAAGTALVSTAVIAGASALAIPTLGLVALVGLGLAYGKNKVLQRTYAQSQSEGGKASATSRSKKAPRPAPPKPKQGLSGVWERLTFWKPPSRREAHA